MFLGQSPAPQVAPPKPTASPSTKSEKPHWTIVMFLNVVAILSFIFAAIVALNAKSAIHEIEAAIAVLCFICALSGAAIISELRRIR